MSFDVAAEAYFRFMGRYAEPLADEFVGFAGVEPGQRALDVGCGPGALTARLVDRLGVDSVVGIDPSAPFVEATRQRFPGIDVRAGGAEHLPFDDNSFDLALAQLVVHFMTDPVAGLREMARVTRPGGTVAACVWDHSGGTGPLSLFWDSVHDVDPDADDESDLAGSRSGHLVELFEMAGLSDVERGSVSVTLEFATFEEWWDPFTLGVGPAGAYLARLDELGRDAVRAAAQRRTSDATVHDHRLRLGRPRQGLTLTRR